ncbi:sensor domain-containing protein [Vulcaniibacterium gelatinicum]|uniref:sensor domain-containing protein n=1 Tax=Vulcaniibacterium gelatinicum TaxID=2598725 RepID=UPI0011C8143F|nr:EAL domain-containing protein [Vulcaniibacterium gelatinicum]
MNSRLPPPESDAAATLAALREACEAPDLPDHLRVLLRQAHDALQAEAVAAQAARNRWRALFDAVPDPVSIISWEGIVLDLNKAGVAAYQRPREHIVGQPIHVLNPDLPRDHMLPVWEVLGRGETYVVDVTNMRADGTRFPVQVHSAAFDDEGERRIVAVARNMSGHREAELRYRELMETMDNGIVIRDADGRIVYGNPAILRMLSLAPGQRLEEELNRERWLIVDERGQELEYEDVPARRALRTGRIVESTVLGFYDRLLRRLIWFSVTAVPQFGPGGGRPQQVLSLFSDVTALKRDSALFERVQALAHIGGWEWDSGRDSLHLTAETQRILGRTPETLEGLLESLREKDRRQLLEAVRQCRDAGEGFDRELQGTRPDGHAFWVRMIGEVEPGDPTGARLAGTLQDITERKQAEETLRVQARSDPLTGLLNRDAVLAELETRLSDPAQSRLAVLYVDLDRFKIVNDVLGHAAGDQVLARAAARIQHAVGTEGLIARFGGDEFLVVCDTDDEHQPERLAAAILDVFRDAFRMEGEEFSITASIGIARAPVHGDRPHVLIQNADLAMYDSKRRLRNSWQGFSGALAEQQLQRLQMETHLRRAIENDELRLVYQPQVDLVSGRIVGAEALIRWRNPVLGEMRPDRFISHAEVTGDIVRIGNWVLHQACRQLRRWRDAGIAVGRISVNVSYRQFLAENLAERVAAALDAAGIPGEALELEFTERVLIEDAPDTLDTLDALRALGVTLSIDDFGEGYSALNYLRRLPIQGMKLSQQFLHGVPHNASDVAICQAVAGIAQSLGLHLVAEGIESDAQRQFLLRMGVTTGQGFLYAPGLAPDELALRLATPLRIRHA